MVATNEPSTGGTTTTAGSGLTLTGSVLSNDLLTGIAGGQTITGGTGASENLTIRSTSNATKGFVYIGSTTGLVWDDTVKAVGIGISPATGSAGIHAVGVAMIALFKCSSAAQTSTATIQNDNGGASLNITAYGSSAAGNNFGIARAGTVAMLSTTGTGWLGIGTLGGIDVVFGTTNLERARIDAAGNFVVGAAALVTTATDGFLYIPGGAGAPTGVPTAKAGRYPLYWNTTQKKLHVYDGAWLGATAPGVWS